MNIPFKNSTLHEIELELEPEGDCIGLGPGDNCVIRLLVAADDLGKIGLEIECRERAVSILAVIEKEVFVNGERVR